VKSEASPGNAKDILYCFCEKSIRVGNFKGFALKQAESTRENEWGE